MFLWSGIPSFTRLSFRRERGLLETGSSQETGSSAGLCGYALKFVTIVVNLYLLL